MTFSGVGLTIGSIASNVKNITFRDCYMKNTFVPKLATDGCGLR